jgi:hypothetical protein
LRREHNVLQPTSASYVGSGSWPCENSSACRTRRNISTKLRIMESKLLRARRSIPCWRIVSSTFRRCMSFHAGWVKFRHCMMSAARPLFRRKRKSIGGLAMSPGANKRHRPEYSSARLRKRFRGTEIMECGQRRARPYSALMPANLITLAHFCVSHAPWWQALRPCSTNGGGFSLQQKSHTD